MRKSNNYSKFLEYIAFGVGGNHGDVVYTDNGVLECVAEARVEGLEGYSKLFNCKYDKMTMDSDTWLKFKVVLVNEEVIEVYYVADSHETHIDTFVLDNFRTQKDVLTTVHQKVVEFFLNNESFCEYESIEEVAETTEEATEDCNEYEEILDSKESTERDRVNYLMRTNSFPSISGMYNDKCFCCPADRPGNRCCGEKWCAETWKRYEAIINPEWHHVSLSTLANLDFDMLDEKRQTYFTVYRDLKQRLTYLRKCKTLRTYDKCIRMYIMKLNSMYAQYKTSTLMIYFIESKISMQNAESGIWASEDERATGSHKSRRYNKNSVDT